MIITCGSCGKKMRVKDDVPNGQIVRCPGCGARTKIELEKTENVSTPGGLSGGEIAVPSSDDRRKTKKVERSEQFERPVREKPKLKVMRSESSSVAAVRNVDGRKINMAEERLKMYEDLKHKEWRRKTIGRWSSVAFLVAIPLVGWFLYTQWTEHNKRVERDEELKRRAAEAEQERLDREREAERRRKAEAERLEQEERLAKERAEREREESERRRKENERKMATERYRLFTMALQENEFDLFTEKATNDLATAGGELCYLVPTDERPLPLYWSVYFKDGSVVTTKIFGNGDCEVVDAAVLAAKLANQDYLVARDDKVYFSSRRKNRRAGALDKENEIDPATLFFGNLDSVLGEIKPTYDELTFDIVFQPKNSGKEILCENVEFGCRYSLQSVREAVEKAFPQRSGGSWNSSKAKRFKRTVKLWNGSHVKQGIDGITYVPRLFVDRSSRHHNYYHYTYGPGVWHTSTRGRDYYYGEQERANWQSLYNQAVAEDAREKAYYEEQKQTAKEDAANRRNAEGRAYDAKIDKIIRDGTLFYRIRKAKRK